MKQFLSLVLSVVLSTSCFSQTPSAPIIHELNLSAIPSGKITHYWFQIGANGLNQPVLIPIIVAKGKQDGPVLGIEAAIHGNELNGIAVIHKLMAGLDINSLQGTIVAVPGVNVPGILNEERVFPDLEDLNRIMPGEADGNESQVYASRYFEKVASTFQYLVDLHTASFGRVNCNYVRADLSNPKMASLAQLQNSDIILNSKEASTSGGSGTIRSALTEKGVLTITVELGNPQVYQEDMISNGVNGLWNTLSGLGMIKKEVIKPTTAAVMCKKSYWIYTDEGGLLEVLPELKQVITKGFKIAVLKNAFGDVIKEYFAPENGIIIGKSNNPVTPSGGRIIHLGILQ